MSDQHEVTLAGLSGRAIQFGSDTVRVATEALREAFETNEQRRSTRNIGNPPTSNISSWTLAKMLLANPDGPVLVMFDDQAGVAGELYVLTQISDAPDWADPTTVYIDARGG
jgi:hypothetical protein